MTKVPGKRVAAPPSTPAADADGDTEKRILDAARTVFVRRGTSGARMQEIAAEAGVNQALLHYYFRSKDRLAQAIFREAAGRLLPAVARVLGADDLSLEEKVQRFVHLYIDTVRQNPFLPGYILAELHQHPQRLAALQEAVGMQPALLAGALIERLGAQLRERAAAGTMRPIAPEQFVVNLLALSVFPFAARPLLHVAFRLDDAGFERFLDARRAELPGFILAALRP
ncbi:MAG TPA: TetR/AcrR family transcriptional regulator [Gemmatimonadaceae bacterium]|nr:TetR/AcrR family transcriptional regulator [Gemmatimonadaceae bacterium]